MLDVAIPLTVLSVAAVFALSGVSKAQAPGDFALALTAMLPVGRRPAMVLAGSVIALECAVAVVLVLPSPRLLQVAALAAAAGFLLAASAVVVRLVRAGADLSCNCFGSGSATTVGGHTLVRNAILVSVTGLALVLAATADATTLTPLSWPETPVVAAVAACAGVALSFSDEVVSLLTGPPAPAPAGTTAETGSLS